MIVEVEVCRTAYGFSTVKVDAETLDEACSKALEMAGDLDFSAKSTEYVWTDRRIVRKGDSHGIAGHQDS